MGTFFVFKIGYIQCIYLFFFVGMLKKSSIKVGSSENAKEIIPKQKERSHLRPCTANSIATGIS